jgi:hypothetical protein
MRTPGPHELVSIQKFMRAFVQLRLGQESSSRQTAASTLTRRAAPVRPKSCDRPGRNSHSPGRDPVSGLKWESSNAPEDHTPGCRQLILPYRTGLNGSSGASCGSRSASDPSCRRRR